MSFMAPFIPDNAPFNVAQRAWLNAMLADVFQPAPVAVVQSLSIHIVFASQGGTAERLARKMAKRLTMEGHTAMVRSVEQLNVSELSRMEHAVFFASTYGEGEPPESARSFHLQLSGDVPHLAGLRYAVFCLGDRNYEQFCQFGIELDERLHALGGSRLVSRLESDVDVDEPFGSWAMRYVAALGETPSGAQQPVVASPISIEAKPSHTRDTPFHAEVVEKRVLTHASSSKQTIHVSFDLAASGMMYEAGDACGVIAQNDPAVVEELMTLLPFSGSETAVLPKVGSVTVEELLRHHLQVTCLTRKTVHAFAANAACATLSTLLADDAATLERFTYGRGLVDLLQDYPGVITSADALVAMLPRLAPRLYSISSSPSAHGRELHCTVGVVRYTSHGRERGGVASTMLAHRMDVGARMPIFVQPNKRFRIPKDSAAPMIMIGPGTGIAPFRAFLHERQALGHAGKNWLFFGERSAETDFLYRRDLETFVDDGHLTRLDTAFSRDQAHKVYVQDRMLEHGAELYRWLQDGAAFYVCGDASRMAKDVDTALHRIVEEHGGHSREAAQEYITDLNETHRYHRDVY